MNSCPPWDTDTIFRSVPPRKHFPEWQWCCKHWPVSAPISKYFCVKRYSTCKALNITMLNNCFQPICQAFYYLSQNSTRMLLPFSVHKYHTWAVPGAAELQLQVLSKQFNFIQQEVHVLSAHLWADHHLTEEVDFAPVGLVPKHHAALLHHSFFNYWSNLKAETEKAYCHPQKYTRFGQKLFFCFMKLFWSVWVLHPLPVFQLPAPRNIKAQTWRLRGRLCTETLRFWDSEGNQSKI